MESTIEERIERQLDELEAAGTSAEIERIQSKIEYLRSLAE